MSTLDGDSDSVEYTINLQHYKLTDEEKAALILLFQEKVGYDSKVTTIEIPISKLTPKMMRSEFDVVVMYDFEVWSSIYIPETNPDSLFHNPMGGVLLYVPQANCNGRRTKSGYCEVDGSMVVESDRKSEVKNPMLSLSASLLGYVQLVFCDLSYFSITTSIMTD